MVLRVVLLVALLTAHVEFVVLLPTFTLIRAIDQAAGTMSVAHHIHVVFYVDCSLQTLHAGCRLDHRCCSNEPHCLRREEVRWQCIDVISAVYTVISYPASGRSGYSRMLCMPIKLGSCYRTLQMLCKRCIRSAASSSVSRERKDGKEAGNRAHRDGDDNHRVHSMALTAGDGERRQQLTQTAAAPATECVARQRWRWRGDGACFPRCRPARLQTYRM